MKKILLTSLLLINSYTFADALNVTQQKDVQHVIDLFKKRDISEIAQSVNYPLKREQPVPDIKNATKMKARFNQVFDRKLSQQIANSKLSQWQSMGWRGVMLDDGIIWLDGNKITAVNYSSLAEQQLKKQLISGQKQKLYPALKNFKTPEFQFKTAKFLVRIDAMSNGTYRYASWAKKQSQSDKPDLILNNGTLVMDGSGGNHHYVFKSGNYQYIVYRNLPGTINTPEISLEVSKNSKQILKQNGQIIK
nr:hypothetical protein [Acinetobacter sp. Marseille-Q1620]